MDVDKKKEYLLKILGEIEIEQNLKLQALDAEREVAQTLVTKVQEEQGYITSEAKNLDEEIRKINLHNLKHQWSDEIKVIQAKTNKWVRKEYEEKLEALQHNTNHLESIIDLPEYELHLSLIESVSGYGEKVEILIKIHEERKKKDEYLVNNPAESFISRVAKERVEIK
jgi:hypothetical protein